MLICTNNRCEIPEGNPNSTDTLSVLLTYDREQLLYDIANLAYISAHAINDDDGSHLRHMIIDITQTGNRNRVLRILALVHAHVTELLLPMSKQTLLPETHNDLPTEPDKYNIALDVPAHMSRTTMQALEHYVHELMVARVLADWYSTLNVELAATWEAKATVAEDEINKIKNSRSTAMTRPCWPPA